ncbi:hypothetical protein ACF081_15175 [Streptomyces longwoodensis]|uniref:hypothetical protein n=1 Tax=Streptomyces longwoodensis TaxID=68231 RepID=UPI0036F6813A
MRIRATVAALSGALVLSALAVPAATAADGGPSKQDVVRAALKAADGKSAYTGSTGTDTGTPYPLSVTFSNVKVNSGKPIVAGPTGHVVAPVTYTVTHSADVDLRAADTWVDVTLYRGSYDAPANFLEGDNWPVCTAVSATVDTCKGTVDVRPAEDLYNVDATTWKATGYVIDWNDVDPYSTDEVDWSKVGVADQDNLAAVRLQRRTAVTVNASPEPVRKGATITATGRLTIANWNTGVYSGYAGVYAQLQFRKAGTTTYSTVKSVKTTSTGGLSTTVKASVDGYWRYNFVGTNAAPAIAAAGDYVDVR